MSIIYAWLVILTIFCFALLKLQSLAKDVIEELVKLQKIIKSPIANILSIGYYTHISK